MAPEVGFGATFPCCSASLSTVYLANQANSRTARASYFHCFLLAILLASDPTLVDPKAGRRECAGRSRESRPLPRPSR